MGAKRDTEAKTSYLRRVEFNHYQGEAPPSFAHPSELEFAKILDFHEVSWQYEPHEFVLRACDEDGHEREVGPAALVDGGLPEGWQASMTFCPDFYLPEQGLYVETTVMKQSLTTKKNRKARLTRERYDVDVKILYRRDFEMLSRQFCFELPLVGTATRHAPSL